MLKPKVTFTSTPVVHVRITVEEPHTIDDDYFIERFYGFLERARCDPVTQGELTKGGWSGGFTAKDATKLEAWLLDQGVEKEETPS